MELTDAPDPRYQATYRRLPDLAKLRDALAPLPHRHRLAFGVCCCERLYRDYQALVVSLQVSDLLRPILAKLWKHVIGQEMTDDEIAHAELTCRTIPLGENDRCEHYSDAVDAVGAVYVVLAACRRYSLDNVVRAAQLSRDRIDRPLWNDLAAQIRGGVGSDERLEIENVIRSHPAMVDEIEKEAKQLRFLYECDKLTEADIARLLSL